MPFRALLSVRTYELDSFGHVNNSVYLNYFEAARSEYLKEIGLSFHDFAAHGVQLVIVEAHVKYISPARYGDEIAVQGSFKEVRAASLIIEYTLTNTATEKLIATGSTRGAFIDAATGRPIRAPEPFASAFARAAEL